MKIIIPGGTGQVGVVLAQAFHRDGHEVVVLSRNRMAAPWRVVQWDGKTPGPWANELENADLVINLAGRSVNCRYNAQNRREITESRVDSVKVLEQAFKQLKQPPRVWMQACTATIYAHRYDQGNDEKTGILERQGTHLPDTWNFSVGVADAWEKAFDEAILPHTRKLKLRISILMSPRKGGAFEILLRLVRFGLGGRSGNGRQYISWIHYEDLIRSIYWLMEHGEIDGVVNLAAPNPLPNKDFMKGLRTAWGIPFGLPAFEWMLEIGAIFIKTETELVLKSRRVVPGRLLEHGFVFNHPSWDEAASNLCQQWKRIRNENQNLHQ